MLQGIISLYTESPNLLWGMHVVSGYNLSAFDVGRKRERAPSLRAELGQNLAVPVSSCGPRTLVSSAA